MEHELKDHLRRTAAAFAETRKLELSTVGRLAAGDWRFFDRLSQDEKSFTARKYDEVMVWFSANWPDAAEWPANVTRPQVIERAAS